MPKKEESEYITLARIIRPRGNKGEVAAENLAADLRCFKPGRKVHVVLPGRARLELEISRAWRHKGRLILGFAGLSTISEAELLRQADVQIAKEALGPPPDGQFLFDDLTGCKVVDEVTGGMHGLVANIYEPPGGVLLFSVVDSDGKELLVPFANEICRDVDIEGKRILVRLPEGMEELKA